MYGAKHYKYVDDARYELFMKMTGGSKVLTKVKKINCSSLPPCNKTLHKHIQRANYVAMMWHNADKPNPNIYDPKDFVWKENDNGIFQPVWFEGHAMLDVKLSKHDDINMVDGDVESEGEWSNDSTDSEPDE